MAGKAPSLALKRQKFEAMVVARHTDRWPDNAAKREGAIARELAQFDERNR